MTSGYDIENVRRVTCQERQLVQGMQYCHTLAHGSLRGKIKRGIIKAEFHLNDMPETFSHQAPKYVQRS